MTLFRKTTGKLGEEYAASYLEKLGYRIVERNYRCRMGEIDIILRDGPVLVFVEVRTLRSLNYGLPQESINQRKVSKVRSVALQYITRKKFIHAEIRFDVVAIQLTMEGCLAHIEYIKNAF